jgi:hypothetical protein
MIALAGESFVGGDDRGLDIFDMIRGPEQDGKPASCASRLEGGLNGAASIVPDRSAV